MRIIKIAYFFLIVTVSAACNSVKKGKNDKPVVPETMAYEIDTVYCKCGYFSVNDKNEFLSTQDSISKTLLVQSDSIVVFGFHSEGINDLLFIKRDKSSLVYHLVEKGQLVDFPDRKVSTK